MRNIFIVFILLIFSLLLFGKVTPVKADGCNNNNDCKHLGEGWYCLPKTHGGFGECQPPDKGGGTGDQGQANIKCNCTAEFSACVDKFGKTDIQWRQCTKKASGSETCNWRVGTKLYQTKACESGPTATPGGPTATPGGPTPTTGVVPTDNPNCSCNNQNKCSSACTFEGVSGTANVKCELSSTFFQSTPADTDKTDWCQRPKRTLGDANGDYAITNLDYMYYVSAVNGGKIPVTVNPDFNGDGEVGAADRTIIIGSL